MTPKDSTEWRNRVAARSLLVVRLIECCALRVSEACDLQWGDIDSAAFGVWEYHPSPLLSDIWLDDTATQRAAQIQTEVHKAFIRSRWMPAFVDAVEYGKFGRATVTATALPAA